MEAGGTVTTEGSFHVVLVHIVVTDPGEVTLRTVVAAVVVEVGDFREVTQVIHVREHLVGLVAVEIVIVVGIVLVADEGVHAVVAELMAPAKLLLERPVLVIVFVAAAAAVVALTVTDDRGVVSLLDVRAGAKVAVDG